MKLLLVEAWMEEEEWMRDWKWVMVYKCFQLPTVVTASRAKPSEVLAFLEMFFSFFVVLKTQCSSINIICF